jgi:hypothetical protein
MQPTIEIITPEVAVTYLNQIHRNQRRVSQHRVDALAEDMTTGNWFDSNDGIAFDENGFLINGQHRLLAIVKSGIAQQFIVIRNLSEKAFFTMDRGVKRTAKHQLQTLGRGGAHSESFMVLAGKAHGREPVPNHIFMSIAEKYRESANKIPSGRCVHYTATLKAVLILGAYHGINTTVLERVRKVIKTGIPENEREYVIAAWIKFRERLYKGSSKGRSILRNTEWGVAQRLVKALEKGEVIRLLRSNSGQENFYPVSLD